MNDKFKIVVEKDRRDPKWHLIKSIEFCCYGMLSHFVFSGHSLTTIDQEEKYITYTNHNGFKIGRCGNILKDGHENWIDHKICPYCYKPIEITEENKR